jgi:hypothetical protein
MAEGVMIIREPSGRKRLEGVASLPSGTFYLTLQHYMEVF